MPFQIVNKFMALLIGLQTPGGLSPFRLLPRENRKQLESKWHAHYSWVMKKTILAIGLNPVMQKTLVLEHLWENEVNRSNHYFLSVAGKGANTARVLTELGAETIHLTHAGGIFTEMFKHMLIDEGIELRLINSKSEIRFCYTLLNSELHTVTEIVEEALPVAPETDRQMREQYLQLLPEVDIITISGTKAAGYTKDIVPWMVKNGTEAGKKLILDVRGDDLLNSIPFKPLIIKPNMKEFAETLFPDELFHEHKTEQSILEIVKSNMIMLYRDHGIHTVLTRGAKSVLYCSSDSVSEMQVTPVVPVNTIGSGDAFTAGLTYGISLGLSLGKSIEIAADCGKKNALNLKPGTIRSSEQPL